MTRDAHSAAELTPQGQLEEGGIHDLLGYCGSRGSRSPRSTMQMRAPLAARLSATAPPPTPSR